jgi:hypothetical protein
MHGGVTPDLLWASGPSDLGLGKCSRRGPSLWPANFDHEEVVAGTIQSGSGARCAVSAFVLQKRHPCQPGVPSHELVTAESSTVVCKTQGGMGCRRMGYGRTIVLCERHRCRKQRKVIVDEAPGARPFGGLTASRTQDDIYGEPF